MLVVEFVIRAKYAKERAAKFTKDHHLTLALAGLLIAGWFLPSPAIWAAVVLNLAYWPVLITALAFYYHLRQVSNQDITQADDGRLEHAAMTTAAPTLWGIADRSKEPEDPGFRTWYITIPYPEIWKSLVEEGHVLFKGQAFKGPCVVTRTDKLLRLQFSAQCDPKAQGTRKMAVKDTPFLVLVQDL